MTSLMLLLACGGDRVTLVVPSEAFEAFEALARHTPIQDLTVTPSADPASDAGGRGLQVAVVQDLDCTECFELTGDGSDWTVHGGDLLGLQYGVAHLFEQGLGYRFLHPHDPWVPAQHLDPTALGGRHNPEIDRRGLHLHTLHPTDAFMDFWEPDGDAGLARAEAVLDWAVKQRANHVQWVGLDDIADSGFRHEDWVATTAQILEMARTRGLTTGLGLQLFGAANLQQSFDLLDDVGTEAEQRAEMHQRLSLLSEGLDFDVYNLSFGEFYDEDPQGFVDSATWAVEEMQAVQPGVEVPAVVHVGADLTVEYQGEDLLYYHLAKHVEGLTPWVHTVMFYTLFDDAGGAYHHEEFSEHRALLLDRLHAGEPVGYFPETAYWVAFDNPVPQALPLYARSRHRDLDQIRLAGATLEDHVLFSSGWEWGYWAHDVAALRHSYTLQDDWCGPIRFMLEPQGSGLADLVCELGDLQATALIDERLAPWLAGQDNLMVLGYNLDIVSQPVRPVWEDLVAYDDEARALFDADVLIPLVAYRDALQGLSDRAAGLDLADNRVVREALDGFAVDALRAAFMVEVLGALMDADPGRLDDAQDRMAQAAEVIAARHGDLHDPDPERLVSEEANATIYPFGYLLRADTLCYWERELSDARNVLEDAGLVVPGCSL